MKTGKYFDWTILEEDTKGRGDQPPRLYPHAGAITWPDPATSAETVPLPELLAESTDAVIADAQRILESCHLRHYERQVPADNRARLRALFSLAMQCLRRRQLAPIQAYARTVAHERFRAGYDIGEVQTAMNALEEAVWKLILRRSERLDLAHCLGSITTVLGAAKDVLARAYVSLARGTDAPMLNLRAVFDGPGGNGPDD